MSENDILHLAISQILVSLILISIMIMVLLKPKNVKVLVKVLLPFAGLSLAIIIAFAMVYSLIVINDLLGMQKLAEYDSKSLFDWLRTLGNEELAKHLHFVGVNPNDYIGGNMLSLNIDMLYFSTITFFTVGYGDIVLKGNLRLFPMLEAFVGVMFTTIVIASLITNYQEIASKSLDERKKKMEKYELLQLCLARGHNIVECTLQHVQNTKTIIYTIALQKEGEEISLTFIFNLNDKNDQIEQENLETVLKYFYKKNSGT